VEWQRYVLADWQREREIAREKENERNFISIIGAQVQTRKHTATWAIEMDSVLGGLSWKLRLDVYVRFHQKLIKEMTMKCFIDYHPAVRTVFTSR